MSKPISQAHSAHPNPAPSNDDDEARSFHVLDRITDGTATDDERAEFARLTEARNSARQTPSPSGKVSTLQATLDPVQAVAAPGFASDRAGGALVIGNLPLSSVTSSTDAPTTSTPTALATSTDTSTGSPTSSTPAPALTAHQQQLVADARRRYPVARNVTENLVARPVAWRRLSEAEKQAVVDQLLEDRGATAFTLHIPLDVETDLLAAARRGRKLVQVIADRIKRQFDQHGLSVPAFRFTVERADTLHLHGVMLFDVPLTGRRKEDVRDCLRYSLGRLPGKHSGQQLRIRDFWNARSRWRRYSVKERELLVEELGTSELDYTSNDLKRLATDLHEERRKARSATTDHAEFLPPADDQKPDHVPADDVAISTHSESLASTSVNRLDDSPATPEAPQRLDTSDCESVAPSSITNRTHDPPAGDKS